MRIRFAVGLVLVGASCVGTEGEPVFMRDVTYDTVVVVGDENETNPLFIYGQPWAQLLDDHTTVYSDLLSGGRGRPLWPTLPRPGLPRWAFHAPTGGWNSSGGTGTLT